MKSIIRVLAVASVAASCALVAQGADDDMPLELLNMSKSSKKQEDNFFHVIPLAKKLEGTAEVRMPGSEEWRELEEGKHYPLGTAFRTGKSSSLTVAFGREAMVTVTNGAFACKAQPLGENTRTVYLMDGEIRVKLSRKLPDGKFFVSAPGFTVSNLRGESRYRYRLTGDGDEATIKCVTDTLCVKGRHFEIPEMRAANKIGIRTSKDALFTALYGKGGDCLVKLDQGLVETRDFDTNETKIVPKVLEWHLSPRTAVRIHRAKPAIGERLAVSVMTFNAEGNLKNRCTFGEGLYQLNTGEQGPLSKAEKAAIAKKAAQAAEAANASDTETSEAEAEETEETTEAASGEGGEEAPSNDNDEEDFDF